jgi:Zn-dependent peptidase ImmA (M78 family)/transcriptional regulator with XRE-family HTH domain
VSHPPLNFRMLRLARELRGRTQTRLATDAGIPQARLSRIESGQLPAGEDELRALANALQLPSSFLLEPGVPAAAPLFRKRAIRSAKRVSTIQARLNTAVLIAQRLLNAGVELDPPQTFPEPGEFPAHEPVLAAQELRRAWRLPVGRVDDLTAVIESAAGIVLYVDFGGDDATAAFISTPGDERMWFLLNSREHAGDRLRLSLAHELGHAVLHRRLPAAEESEQELQAFQFAAALLLPADVFDRAIPYDALTLAQARSLKQTYWVSIQAIIRAAYNRGRIGRDRYTSLFKQLSARGWRTDEPVPIPREHPQLWPEVLRVHREDHRFSDHDMAAIAHVDLSTMSDLFPGDFLAPRLPLRVVRSATTLES